MRMMKRRVEPVALFKPTEQKSDYVGTERVWSLAGTALFDVQTADNALLAEEYGERGKNMKTLYGEIGIDIQNGYGAFSLLENGEPAYRIVSVKSYDIGHIVAVAERQVVDDG